MMVAEDIADTVAITFDKIDKTNWSGIVLSGPAPSPNIADSFINQLDRFSFACLFLFVMLCSKLKTRRNGKGTHEKGNENSGEK